MSDHPLRAYLFAGLLLGLSPLLLTSCAQNNGHGHQDTLATLTIKNHLSADLNNRVVSLSIPDEQDAGDWSDVSFQSDTATIPAEAVDMDGDGSADAYLLELSLPANSSRTITAVKSENPTQPTRKTHAELSVKEGGIWKDRVYEGGEFTGVRELAVPPEHTDHSFYIRYEGPGWESDKVGYRFYLDWRNAIDIFGKKQPGLVLHQVGLDGFDSYHEMAGWGMDILKVGEALGLGSLGCWNNGKVLRVSQTDSLHCEIPADGALESSVRTSYYGWSTPYGKTNLVSTLSIRAGERRTKHTVSLDPGIENPCTGIVKHDGTELITSTNPGGWNYLATWGKQSLAEDMLGMAIFYHADDLGKTSEDEFNHVVVFKPEKAGELTYYLAACWEQEKGGIKTKGQFEQYLKQTIEELNHPVSVELNKS